MNHKLQLGEVIINMRELITNCNWFGRGGCIIVELITSERTAGENVSASDAGD